jgi:hypothetical protein
VLFFISIGSHGYVFHTKLQNYTLKNLNCKMNLVVVVVMNLASFSHQRMHKMDLLSGYLFIIGS